MYFLLYHTHKYLLSNCSLKQAWVMGEEKLLNKIWSFNYSTKMDIFIAEMTFFSYLEWLEYFLLLKIK